MAYSILWVNLILNDETGFYNAVQTTDILSRCCPSSPRGRPPCQREAGTPRHPTWICKCNQQLRQSSPPCPAHTRHLLSPLARERNTMLRSIILLLQLWRLSESTEGTFLLPQQEAWKEWRWGGSGWLSKQQPSHINMNSCHRACTVAQLLH